MSNIEPAERNTWASFARRARQDANLSQVELGHAIGVARQTVGRWESGRFRPESADDAVAFARATGVDPEEALAAAGFRPTVPPPAEPTKEPDPELDRIRASHLSPERKKELIRYVLARRARDEAARLEDLEHMIRER